jgi:T-complex protein 1 subunit epsilon
MPDTIALQACEIAKAHLESISDTVEFSVTDNEPLITTAMTTLSSKIINVHKRQMAEVRV